MVLLEINQKGQFVLVDLEEGRLFDENFEYFLWVFLGMFQQGYLTYFYEFDTKPIQFLLFELVDVFLKDVESMQKVVSIEFVLGEKLGGTIQFLFSQFDLPVVSQSENGVQ